VIPHDLDSLKPGDKRRAEEVLANQIAKMVNSAIKRINKFLNPYGYSAVMDVKIVKSDKPQS
jgi:hypothetical protein